MANGSAWMVAVAMGMIVLAGATGTTHQQIPVVRFHAEVEVMARAALKKGVEGK